MTKSAFEFVEPNSTILAKTHDNSEVMYIQYKKIFIVDKYGSIREVSWENAICSLCCVNAGQSDSDHWSAQPAGQKLLSVLEPDFFDVWNYDLDNSGPAEVKTGKMPSWAIPFAR